MIVENFKFQCKKLLSVLLSLQEEMKRFLAKIVDLMKQENLFASQGGPIILAQVIHQQILKYIQTEYYHQTQMKS